MLDPISVTIAALLAQKAAEALAEDAGHLVWNRLDRLRRTVLERFGGDASGTDALAALEAAPTSAEHVARFAQHLDQYVQSDPAFRESMAHEIADAAREPELRHFLTQVAGDGRVGKIVNIGEVHGDVTF